MTTNPSGTIDPYELADPLRPGIAIAETLPRVSINGNQAATSGTIRFTAIIIPAGKRISSFTYSSAGQAAVGPTNQWVAFTDNSMNLLRFSQDDLTTAWAVNSRKLFTLTTPWVTQYTGLYYVGLLIAVSTTMPNLHAGASGGMQSVAPVTVGDSNSGLTTIASAPQAVFNTPTPATALQMQYAFAA